jgi:hypothetical protein
MRRCTLGYTLCVNIGSTQEFSLPDSASCSTLALSASCSICGTPAASTTGARDPSGAFVCQACIEHARKVIMGRLAAKARAEHETKTQKLVEAAEQDNRWVMDLRTDDALAAAAHQCLSCGRFMELESAGCYSCGYGTHGQRTPMGMMPGRWKLFGRGRAFQSGRTTSALLPWLDPRVAYWTPRLVTLALLLVVGAGAFVPWAWTSALVMLTMTTLLVAGLVLVAAFSLGRRTGGVLCLIVILGATAGLWATDNGHPLRQKITLGIAVASMLALSFFVAKRVRDRFVSRLWWGVLLSWFITAGIIAWRTYR